MGNFVTFPSFKKTYQVSNSQNSSIPTCEQTPVQPSQKGNYHVYCNLTNETQSPRWNRFINRQDRKCRSNRIKTTRYNIITFLPKNIFEQFHRVANIYFAILIGLNWIPIINAISKTVAFLPLTVILTITAIKDLVEDLKRWRSDVNINKQIAHVYDKTSKQFTECKWQDLVVGDIVRVRPDETVPADILLVSSSSEEKTCFIDTAAIDGESNLKQKSIPSCFINTSNVEETSFELQCDPPNDDIYHFHGRITLPTGQIHPCDNNNFLLRGCIIRITDHVDGLVVYAGNKTKIIKSSRVGSSKHALIERSINRDIIFSSIILTIISFICAGLSTQWNQSFGSQWRFVPFLVDDPFQEVAGNFFASVVRFVILFQVMIPIALYVSLDIVRVLQMASISADEKLKHDRAIACRTFTINEDLGQVGYIFSDKTGTLTQNKLVFKAFCIGAEIYTDLSKLPSVVDDSIEYFLTAMSICNTTFIVHANVEDINRLDYQPKYEGDNADDLVLCQAAADFGVRMVSRSAQNIHVRYLHPSLANTDRVDRHYELLCLLPFDSTRKRMSVIVRSGGQIFLFIKGAETSIWPYQSPLNDSDLLSTIEQQNIRFAEQGYRSLLVAYRQIPLSEFEDWFARYQNAASSFGDREEAISEIASRIEVDLIILGVTAVEDRLQENVPNAIATLRCAGIKIWLLTGDKQATALSTAQAASLVNLVNTRGGSATPSENSRTSLLELDAAAYAKLSQLTYMIYYSSQAIETEKQARDRNQTLSDEERVKQTIARMSANIAGQDQPVSVVVTGDDLDQILQYDDEEFIKALAPCQSVIFCRVTATQKRELVTISKTIFQHRILAIGDGANDVGMIRESHCGVAVYGREGSQAVAAGDFAVDRFSCLCRLLLVHGAWCYARTSELILFTFMHNCSYVFVVLFHQIFNGFSGAMSLHSLYIILYTSLFSVLPQCASALFDEHVSEHRALREPQLYQYTLQAYCYRPWLFWLNTFDAIWQSSVIFFVAYLSYINQSNFDGLSLGFLLTFSMTVVAMIHVLIQAARIDLLLIGSVLFSLVVFFGFTLIFDVECVQCLNGESPYQVSYYNFRQGRFWFTFLFIIIGALLPRLFAKIIYNMKMNPLLKKKKNQ